MLIPNFVPTTFWLSATLKAIGTTGIAVMFLGIAAFLRCDGEPYVNFAQLAAKGMPWDLVFMISTALTLAGALVSQDSGFIVKNVGGILGAGSAIGFIVIFLVASAILTNLINNIVVSAIFIPIMYTFSTSLGFDPVPVVVLFIIVCNMAIMLPSSSPAGAMIHSNKGWVPGTSAIKYGFIFMIMSTLIAICIGLPMLKIFF